MSQPNEFDVLYGWYLDVAVRASDLNTGINGGLKYIKPATKLAASVSSSSSIGRRFDGQTRSSAKGSLTGFGVQATIAVIWSQTTSNFIERLRSLCNAHAAMPNLRITSPVPRTDPVFCRCVAGDMLWGPSGVELTDAAVVEVNLSGHYQASDVTYGQVYDFTVISKRCRAC